MIAGTSVHLDATAEGRSAHRWLRAAFLLQTIQSAFWILLGIVALTAFSSPPFLAEGVFFIVVSLLFLGVGWFFCLGPAGRGMRRGPGDRRSSSGSPAFRSGSWWWVSSISWRTGNWAR
ncbi:MAG: hypothetical protein ACREDK_00590 [Thermoplasmata archaeon]